MPLVLHKNVSTCICILLNLLRGDVMDKKDLKPLMNTIKNSYGYDKQGTHLKKCEICEAEYEEPNDLNYLVVNGPQKCPHCTEILALKEVLIDYSNKFRRSEWDNPVFNKNMIKDGEYDLGYGKTQSYRLDEFTKNIVIEGRTKRVQEIIDRIVDARKFIYFDLAGKIEVLKSIYKNKDRFWADGGNLVNQVSEMTVEYIVIKLNEFLSTNVNNYKYSISKIRNIINNDKIAIYDNQKIIDEKKFKISGEVMRSQYPRFEIENYLSKLDKVLDDYRMIISAIDDYRDNKFAHINNLKKPESSKSLTYRNIIKIFNSLKIIYDGFLYSVAPDLFSNLVVDFNIWFGNLNQISQYYYDNVTKIHRAEESILKQGKYIDFDSYNINIIAEGLKKYSEITNLFNKIDDVSKDIKFQTMYDGFYRVRRNSEWRKCYFELMQIARKKDLSFSDVINYIYDKTGNVEASFSSKLLATIDPNKPIWDQYVLNNLKLKPAPQYKDDRFRINRSIELYDKICEWYKERVESDFGKAEITFFDAKFPRYSWITSIKKIDFLLWSKR